MGGPCVFLTSAIREPSGSCRPDPDVWTNENALKKNDRVEVSRS
jgi:hypothetical protein